MLLQVELQFESCTLIASASAPEAPYLTDDSPSPEEYSFEAEPVQKKLI